MLHKCNYRVDLRIRMVETEYKGIKAMVSMASFTSITELDVWDEDYRKGWVYVAEDDYEEMTTQ